MKKILIIKGSSRKEGFTNTIAKEIEKLYEKEEITVFDCFKEVFKPCNGCNFCENNGRCVNSDLNDFYSSFENADVIFFLSPVYNGTFSAPLKALIDRFQVYYTSFYVSGKKQKIEKKRDAYFIASAGRDGKIAFDYMTSQLKCSFTILNIELKDAFLCSFTDTNPTLKETIGDIKRSLINE